MSDVAQEPVAAVPQRAAALVAEVKAKVAGLESRVASIETAAQTDLAAFVAPIRSDMDVVWQHKKTALFDLAVAIGLIVLGWYLRG